MKCATTSLYAVLPGRFVRPGEMGAVGYRSHPVPTERLAPVQWTVCRNPYDRAVSIWASAAKRMERDKYWVREIMSERGGNWESFREFVALILMRDPKPRVASLFEPQWKWHDQFTFDRLVRFESLKAEVETIVGPLPELPKKNVSERDDWRAYYDAETAEMVEQWAGEDFSRYGYPLWSEVEAA